jgi:hypothetical protein
MKYFYNVCWLAPETVLESSAPSENSERTFLAGVDFAGPFFANSSQAKTLS